MGPEAPTAGESRGFHVVAAPVATVSGRGATGARRDSRRPGGWRARNRTASVTRRRRGRRDVEEQELRRLATGDDDALPPLLRKDETDARRSRIPLDLDDDDLPNADTEPAKSFLKNLALIDEHGMLVAQEGWMDTPSWFVVVKDRSPNSCGLMTPPSLSGHLLGRQELRSSSR